MLRIKVNNSEKHPRPYFPMELIRDGFIGRMEILNDAITATIIHPHANLEQVKKSLQITLQNIELRMERQGKTEKKPIITLNPITKRFTQSFEEEDNGKG